MKYLYKYVHKDHDAASVQLQSEGTDGVLVYDEIQNFLDVWYVAVPEAIVAFE